MNKTIVTGLEAHSLSVLFLCMGNICRSPTAHGVFRKKVRASGLDGIVNVDSAGTHNYHPGEPPDLRSQRAAAMRGYDIADLRARQITIDDFARHDLLLAMDWDNLALAEELCPAPHRRKLRRLTEFCRHHQDTVVPDPYYGGDTGFAYVLDLIEDACDGLLEHLTQRLPAHNPAVNGEHP
jgi:protein-tyrosine phosphatase